LHVTRAARLSGSPPPSPPNCLSEGRMRDIHNISTVGATVLPTQGQLGAWHGKEEFVGFLYSGFFSSSSDSCCCISFLFRLPCSHKYPTFTTWLHEEPIWPFGMVPADTLERNNLHRAKNGYHTSILSNNHLFVHCLAVDHVVVYVLAWILRRHVFCRLVLDSGGLCHLNEMSSSLGRSTCVYMDMRKRTR
jgi:hypothetical protein